MGGRFVEGGSVEGRFVEGRLVGMTFCSGGRFVVEDVSWRTFCSSTSNSVPMCSTISELGWRRFYVKMVVMNQDPAK